MAHDFYIVRGVRYGAIMPERTRKQKPGAIRSKTLPALEVKPVTKSAVQGEKLKAELDDLLDEIDDVLETNAEDFVKSYVQKGGE